MTLLVTLRQVAVVVLITAIPTLPFGVFAWWVMRRHRASPAEATGGRASTTPFATLTVLSLLITGAAVLVIAAVLLAVWLL